MIAISALGAVGGVLLPLLTLWRLRSPDRRRDAQLSANAQPRLTVVAHALGALIGLVGVWGPALGAIAGYAVLWAPVWLSAGILVATIISAVIVFRAPADPR